MDLTRPIDINAVIGAVKKYKDLLVAVDSAEAKEILQHFMAIPGVTDSITLGRTTLGAISHRYTGEFIGMVNAGKVVPRTLTVRPVVMEMADEPERYRRSYITDVKGGLWPKNHPFEVWLIAYGLKLASAELFDALLEAGYDAEDTTNALTKSFDGPITIIKKEIAANTISVANGNMVEIPTLTRANVGDELLAMYRKADRQLKKKCVMFISEEVGEMYDSWLDDQGTLITGSGAETAGQTFLRNTNKKCALVRLPLSSTNSQLVIITSAEKTGAPDRSNNICWGYDKDSDFSTLKPFESGNPYKFTAAGKYVIGFQLVTLHKTMLCVSKTKAQD